MKRHSKRFTEATKLIDPAKVYPVNEAVELIKKTSTVKFDAGVEIHIRLGIDPNKADQIVRAAVTLPFGTGKKKAIAVFCEGKDQEIAKKAGAAIVGGEELIKEIKDTGKCNFTLAMATPAMMKKMGQIAKILGPKGMMPNPRNETITTDIAKSMAALAGGKVTFRNDDSGNIHQLVGKVSFDSTQLVENVTTFIEAIRKAKPQGAKGVYIKNISLTSTMGPGLTLSA
jgi:large subunit ribosomal protein L1